MFTQATVDGEKLDWVRLGLGWLEPNRFPVFLRWQFAVDYGLVPNNWQLEVSPERKEAFLEESHVQVTQYQISHEGI